MLTKQCKAQFQIAEDYYVRCQLSRHDIFVLHQGWTWEFDGIHTTSMLWR